MCPLCCIPNTSTFILEGNQVVFTGFFLFWLCTHSLLGSQLHTCCLVIAPLHCLSFVRDCLWAGNPPSQIRFPNQLLVREGEWCCSPVLMTTVKETLEMIPAVLAYLGLCLFLREEVVVGTSVCFPVSCLAFSEKTCCSVCYSWRYGNL